GGDAQCDVGRPEQGVDWAAGAALDRIGQGEERAVEDVGGVDGQQRSGHPREPSVLSSSTGSRRSASIVRWSSILCEYSSVLIGYDKRDAGLSGVRPPRNRAAPDRAAATSEVARGDGACGGRQGIRGGDGGRRRPPGPRVAGNV